MFYKARAEYLAEISGYSAQQLYKHVQKMDDTLLDLPENSNVMLWFDSCIFDQTLLMRILYLLDFKQDASIKVFLYCCNSNSLTADDFKHGRQKKVQLFPEDWLLGTKAWNFFQHKDADGMIRLAQQEKFERLPAMQKALFRCAEEIPGADALNRTQKQILQLVTNRCSSFIEIFKGLSKFEEYPFLGDTSCQRHLDFLVKNNFLAVRNNEYFLPKRR
jgi:hypothetical protein